MNCPRCGGPLTFPLTHNPCRQCGLAFIEGQKPCRKCGKTPLEHDLQCRVPKPEPIPCPLCGGKRHRKTPGSTYECLWNQWANTLPVAPDHTPETERAFLAWREAHPDVLGGSVHAERLIRQAKARRA